MEVKMLEVRAILLQSVIRMIRIVPFSNLTNQLVEIVKRRVDPPRKVTNWSSKDCIRSENGG